MGLSKAAFIAWLNEIETALPVADWHVHDVPVWPLIRLQLYGANYDTSLWPERVGGSRAAIARGAARALGAWARAKALDWRHDADPAAPADAVFLALSYGTQPTRAGRKYNWLLAPYVELLAAHGRTSAVWEMSPGGDYNIPRFTPSHYVQPYLFYERIVSLTTRAHRAAAVRLPEYDQFLRRAAGADLVTRYGSIEALQRDAFFIRRVADGFASWLRRVRPAHGFIVDCWLREQAFCLACREEGVVVVDLQHGSQGALHPAYGSWQGLPPGGYATRPSIFWCWDEDSAAAINAWNQGDARTAVAVAGGDPWRELWVSGTSDMARELDCDIARRRHASGGDRHILLNLDSIGPVIPALVSDALHHSPKTWCYWVRLHPANQRARLPEAIRRMRELGVTHVDPEYASQIPLHALLKHVDAHVTVAWSTVILEAADFGVSSVACHARAGEVYPKQLADGTLRIASSSEELMAMLDLQARVRRPLQAGPRPNPTAAMTWLLSAPRAPWPRAMAGETASSAQHTASR